MYYLRSGGWLLFWALVACLFMGQGASVGAQFQLSAWGDQASHDAIHGQYVTIPLLPPADRVYPFSHVDSSLAQPSLLVLSHSLLLSVSTALILL